MNLILLLGVLLAAEVNPADGVLEIKVPGNGGPFLRIIPSGTNDASGAAPMVFYQGIGEQSTNREIVYIIGFNYADNLIDTNFHGLMIKVEPNWDPADPSSQRQMEAYYQFQARSNVSPAVRFWSWVLSDGPSIKGYINANTLELGHHAASNQIPAVSFLLSPTKNGASKANTTFRGTVSILKDGNGDFGSLLLANGNYLNFQNSSGTASASIRHGAISGNPESLYFEPGANGDKVVFHEWFNQVIIKSNLTVNGSATSASIITKGLTFNGTMTACPTNPLTPAKWLPFTNNGVRYYLPAYQ